MSTFVKSKQKETKVKVRLEMQKEMIFKLLKQQFDSKHYWHQMYLKQKNENKLLKQQLAENKRYSIYNDTYDMNNL